MLTCFGAFFFAFYKDLRCRLPFFDRTLRIIPGTSLFFLAISPGAF
ncbi:hypothetical protein PJE062_128 [Pseudovibrio sp. JE062]|nr:hypothetical protein PJE062_128 [Pseudovibrio sp. JE062]